MRSPRVSFADNGHCPFQHIGRDDCHKDEVPKATIVVTAFDRQTFLRSSLESLDHQTVDSKLFEVIVVDDSGEERIGARAIGGLNAKYDLFLKRTELPYEVNGVSVARNVGITAARGDIIISIDDDCIPNRVFIEEHLAFHRGGRPVIALGHRSEDATKLEEGRPVSVTETKAKYELQMSELGWLNFTNFMTGNVSFPKKVAFEVGLFNESFARIGEHGWEDIEFGYRLWRRGYQTVFARNAAVYRPPTESEKEEQRRRTKAVEKGRERFLALQPLIPEVMQLLNALWEDRKQEAERTAIWILERDPEHVAVLTILGKLYMEEDELKKAGACFKRAEELGGQGVPGLGEIDRCRRGRNEYIGLDRGEILNRSSGFRAMVR